MSQLEAAKEQQRLDAIMNRRAVGLYSSSGGTRTRAADTNTTPKWATPVTTARPAPTTAAVVGTGACSLMTAPATSPPPVPPRSPVMAPPPVPPRSPLMPSGAAVIDDSEVDQCDDQEYRAKCEKQRLDKYISGEWRLARLMRADTDVTKTKTSLPEVDQVECRRERDHKEMCDVAPKSTTSADTSETELTLVSLFIDELVYLLRKTSTTAGYDNAQALVIVKKAKEVKDTVINLTTAISTSPSFSAAARIADDVNALAGAIARLVNGWREGTAVDEETAGGVASQAVQLQQQLRQFTVAQ